MNLQPSMAFLWQLFAGDVVGLVRSCSGPEFSGLITLMTVDSRPRSADIVVRHGRSLPVLGYGGFPKRCVDIVLVLLAAPVAIPLVLGMVLLVALQGQNPFYRQARLGRGGRTFGMLKIRTMVPDAEARLEAHLAAEPEARAEWDCHQKLRNDPRITRIGRFLRKTSMDELPQLWNVLIGDMSLVGPRPMMVEQRKLYPGTAYYMLRPGITGAWQISDRHMTSFAERAHYDEVYLQNLSLQTDMKLMVRTVGVVLRGTGC
ncbi:sugar transferase [Frigidibacter sp. ROC022]|uniref:sugar transferase n=1 Tax=Frigidibacter sp. ROC022 TaxID=2971796 RepID=UPI00215A6A21|nr:sugar transferase [Frigidibacter sp. ROC022]MCR8726783.1 sugar transferase [Frigidibacter sp. ROC022]